MRILAALLLAACAAAQAGDDAIFARPAGVDELKALLAPAQATIANSQALRGRFEQRKSLAGIPRPLVSEGSFTFARDRGVWWHTAVPFESDVVLTRAGMVQTDAGGTPVALSADRQPALRVVADIFLSLFALDLTVLSENFTLHGARAGDGWVLGLQARPGALGGMVRRVTIRGGARVEEIELDDAHGDRTVIRLRDDGRGPAALTPAEAGRFDAIR